MTAIDINVLAVGHPARPAAARALAVTAVGANVFAVFTAMTTQVAAVRAASPWQDDPYDAVVTFTMFFVPGSARSPRCVSCCAGARRTPLLALGLAVVTAAAAVSHVAVRRARAVAPRDRLDDGDWLCHAIVAVALLVVRTGDPSRFAGIRRFLEVVAGFLRAHFVAMAALGSVIVGALVVARLAVAEGSSDGALLVIEAVVFAGGTFAFIMIADAWLQLAAPPNHAKHTVARVGATAATAALPTSLAMRDLIWSTTGHTTDVQTAQQLASVTLSSAIICGVVASAVAYAVTSTARRN